MGAAALTASAAQSAPKTRSIGGQSALVELGARDALPFVLAFAVISAALIIAISLLLRWMRSTARAGRTP